MVVLATLSLRFDPLGEAKSPLDKLFHPARIQVVLPSYIRPLEYFLLEDVMRKIFQKWTIFNVSEESLTITDPFKPIQSQDAVKLLFPLMLS